MPQVSGIGAGSYYAAPTLTGTFVEFKFVDPTDSKQFVSYAIALSTSNTVTFSFDGTNTHGVIVAADLLVIMQNRRARSIWLKGTGTAKVMAW